MDEAGKVENEDKGARQGGKTERERNREKENDRRRIKRIVGAQNQ